MRPVYQEKFMSRIKRFALPAALLVASTTALPVAAQTTFTLSSWVPPAHTLTETQKEWCGLLEKKLPGKVKCNALPRAVAAAPATFDAVRNGLVDVSFTVHGYTPGRFDTTKMAEVPFLGDSAEASSVAFQRMYQKYPAIANEHKGVKVLAVFTHGPGIILNTKRPITKADDLNGLKWRIGGGLINDITKALGMNVTLKPAPESYELLSTGVMDGTLFPAESVEGFKIDKVIKYATQFPGGLYNTSFVFMMNQAKYDSLEPDLKKAVDEISGEFAARMIGKGWDKVDRRGLAFMQAAGVQFTKADPAFVKSINDKMGPLVDNWAKAAEAKGLKDPKKVLGEFRAEIGKLQ
jgi:TRAP-type transport system periplasmic protein